MFRRGAHRARRRRQDPAGQRMSRARRTVGVRDRPSGGDAIHGGHHVGRAGAALLRVSEGNPLAMRELILAGRDTGRLVEANGTWQLQGPVAVSNRLSDLVGDRLDSLDESTYAALEVLALGEPLGLSMLEE